MRPDAPNAHAHAIKINNYAPALLPLHVFLTKTHTARDLLRQRRQGQPLQPFLRGIHKRRPEHEQC